jgi:hypothetical protein
MPYKKIPVGGGEYKVVNKNTGKVYAYHTKVPNKLIQAIEINKLKHNGAHKH